MAVRIDRTLTSEIRPPLKSIKAGGNAPQVGVDSTNSKEFSIQHQGQTSASSIQSATRVADAAISLVKTPRVSSTSQSQKIKDYKEASKVATDLAERVRYDGEGSNAHEQITPFSAREHLIN